VRPHDDRLSRTAEARLDVAHLAVCRRVRLRLDRVAALREFRFDVARGRFERLRFEDVVLARGDRSHVPLEVGSDVGFFGGERFERSAIALAGE
jgi:hypothetical protein